MMVGQITNKRYNIGSAGLLDGTCVSGAEGGIRLIIVVMGEFSSEEKDRVHVGNVKRRTERRGLL